MNEEFTVWNPFEFMENRERVTYFFFDALMDEKPEILSCSLQYAIDYFGIDTLSKKSGLSEDELTAIIAGKEECTVIALQKMIRAVADLVAARQCQSVPNPNPAEKEKFECA